MNEHNVSPVSEAEEMAYTAWILGQDEIVSEEERKSFEARYLNDETFRTETDKLRAAAEFLERNIDPILALIDPAPALPAHEQNEIWREFQKLRAQKRDIK